MSKRKFIIDADTGSDDAVAILMALQDAKQLLIFMTMKKAIRMLELSQNLTMKCF
jgi:inosine-uridine nucleoside N-ribohydrolase